MKIRYIMIVLALMLLVGAASAWLPDYDYRKGHHIEGSSAGDQTNYQVKFVVYRSSGSDSGADVYVETKCEPDYRDIRFTLDDDTILDYWIESQDTSSATIWVEVPSITTADGADLFIYYGNSGASSASDGDATFLFFDDFEGSTLDTGKWTSSGSVTVSGSSATIIRSGSDASITSTSNFGTNTAVRTRMKSKHFDNTMYREYLRWDPIAGSTGSIRVMLSDYSVTYGKKAQFVDDTTSTLYDIPDWTADTFGHIDMIRNAATSSTVIFNNDYPVTETTRLQTGNHFLFFWARGVENSQIDADWVFVRTYLSPEPAHSTWDAEEINLPANYITPDMLPIIITPELVVEAGTTYFELAGDWTSGADDWFAVSIQAPNVVLNGNHYTLTGTPGDYKNAINSDCYNTTVYNLSATGWNNGIAYTNVDYGWISMNNLYSNLNSSIAIQGCTGISLSGNTLLNNGENGLWVGDSSGITVIPEMSINTVISGNPTGISFNNVTNGFIGDWAITADGTLENNDFAAIAVSNSEDITVSGFEFNDNCFGIFYDNVQGGVIQVVTVDGSTMNNIGIANSQDIRVENNALTSGDTDSIGIFDSTNITLVENSVAGSAHNGMYFDNINGLTLQRNVLENNFLNGIVIEGSSDILLSGNGLVGNGVENECFGVLISGCSGVTVNEGNGVSLNYYGIGIADSDNCIVDNNLADSNIHIGIIIGGDNGSSDILVSRNNVNNTGISGINAHNVINLTLLGNTLRSSGITGIDVGECLNVTIQANDASDHLSPDPNPGTGINIWNTLEANTYDNVLTDNVVGIMCGNSTFNYIRNNTITTTYEDTQFALGLCEGSAMTGLLCVFDTSGVHGNVMTGYQQGIALADVADILIFNNYFDNYENYMIGDGTSNITWNVTKTLADPDTNIVGGEYLGGNYWAQPDGYGWSQVTPDTDYDGICDDPYVLDASYTDMLPLGGYQPIHAQFSADPTEGIVNGVDPVVVQFTDESMGTIDEWTWNFDDGTTSSEQNPLHEFFYPGVYSVSLTVGSNETDETDTFAMFVYMRPTIANGIPIWEGWNFVSTPRSLATGHNTVSQVFGEVETDLQPIWYYNAAIPQWEMMEESDIVLPMDGIWIYSTQVGPYVEFTYNTEFGGNTPRVKHLEPGWNAIGIGSVYGMPTDSYLATLGEKWSVLLEFDSGTQSYYSPQIRGIETYGMSPGRGYWIYMDEGGDLLAMTG